MSEPWGWSSEEPLPLGDRLQILSPEKYDLLWCLPRFDPAEHELFFTLNQREKTLLGQLRTPRTKAHFLLQLGYFKSRQRFFPLDLDTVSEDLRYICQRYLNCVVLSDLSVSKHTRQQHVLWILELFEPGSWITTGGLSLRLAHFTLRGFSGGRPGPNTVRATGSDGLSASRTDCVAGIFIFTGRCSPSLIN